MNSWLIKRQITPVKFLDLPRLGFIIPGVAAAFIRQCEGEYVLLDSLVTNPDAPAESRNNALDELYSHIIEVTEGKSILGFTTDTRTQERSIRHGFKAVAYTVLVRPKE